MRLINITDVGNGSVQVSLQVDTAIVRRSPKLIPFVDPLTMNDRKELRWYLEEYLQHPYESWRARKSEEEMAKWGGSLFNSVFVKNSSNPDPYTLYQEAVATGLDNAQLCIGSEDPGFLNIPWELIRDPTPGRGYLSPSLGGMFRCRTGHKIEHLQWPETSGPFRVLLVITRPHGKEDIPFRTIASPMIKALNKLKHGIQFEILRPPTFDALVNRLNSNKGQYSIVHFDGHGVFRKPSGEQRALYGSKANYGHLVFERDDGSEHIVNSQEIGQALVSSRVPLFVLNACQSSEEGRTDPFSSVASQLIATGAKGVLSMSYSIYAIAATKFMERFYEKIAEFASLSEAVAAGRRRLFAEPVRESIFGSINLQDWIVPNLYQQDYSFIPMKKGAKSKSTTRSFTAAVELVERCPEGRFGFIGRDFEVLQIERAFYKDDCPWVLLTGIGGIGKTELAFGFARWFVSTEGCTGGVFPVSFKQKTEFAQIFRGIFKGEADFSRLSDQEQWEELVQHLRERACLLIWDNFETVTGYPHGSVPLASDEDQEKMRRLLKSLRGGKTCVLILTRKPEETWLGINYKLLELHGLRENDAGLLAKAVLDTVGLSAETFKNDPSYLDLIRMLNGHPRSIEIVLPNLRKDTTSNIIDALRNECEQLGKSLEDASLEYAFSQMSKVAQKHLPLIGLFSSYVDGSTLSTFVGSKTQYSKVYKSTVGETLNDRKWRSVLREASDSGLILSMNDRVYNLHPTLSPFLRRMLASMVGESGLSRLDLEFMKFYDSLALSLRFEIRTASSNVVSKVNTEEDNFIRALWIAMKQHEWEIVIDICHVLSVYYEINERLPEWRALRLKLLSTICDTISVGDSWERGRIWRYLLGTEATHALESHDLEFAEEATKRILNYLISLHDPRAKDDIAVAYHELGSIALDRGEIAEAEEWYRKALKMNQALVVTYPEIELHVAANLTQLGLCAQLRFAFIEAESFFNEALGIAKRHRLSPQEADIYHNLGINAREQGRLDEAELLFLKAQAIREKSDLKRNAAKGYYELSIIAKRREQFEKANELVRKGLDFFELFGPEREKGHGYVLLGKIASARGNLDESDQWILKAAPIFARWGTLANLASAYNDLGSNASSKKSFGEADSRYNQALEACKGMEASPIKAVVKFNLGLSFYRQKLMDNAILHLGDALRIAHNLRVPQKEEIISALARLMSTMGKEEFERIWKAQFGDTNGRLKEIETATN